MEYLTYRSSTLAMCLVYAWGQKWTRDWQEAPFLVELQDISAVGSNDGVEPRLRRHGSGLETKRRDTPSPLIESLEALFSLRSLLYSK